MIEKLKKNDNFKTRKGSVVLMILDGVGYGKYAEGDAVLDAPMPAFKKLLKEYPNTKLKAHGKAVGLPDDGDMGNSEVGHNAMGCGRVFAQGALLVNESIERGQMFKGETWKEQIQNVLDNNSTLHFLGLFSDGNVHSHIKHLQAMIKEAKKSGIKKIRIHTLLDGRDVPETSALDYIDAFEDFLSEMNNDSCDFRIASGGGRMVITMDRYNANWSMVEKGWNTHVKGEGSLFKSANEAITKLREETDAIDQDLPPFVISDDNKTPIGPITDGDSVIFFNFRGDRGLEITNAFEDDELSHFDRGIRPDVKYAGMMEYDGDLHIPKKYLVNPPAIDKTLGEYLCATNVKQLAISETQKYGHVTYFFNGNKSGFFNKDLEDYIEVPSDIIPFEERPWMKCAEITDKVCAAIKENKYDFIRLNYPNGDMVGHTGVYQAVIASLTALDVSIERVRKEVEKAGGILIITADHGNADDMFEHKKTGEVKRDENGNPNRKTAHSLNPVPCIIYDPDYQNDYNLKLNEDLGISSIPATIINLLGYVPNSSYDSSVLKLK